MRKIQYNSPVILTYVLLCAGVLLLDSFTGGRSTSLCFCVYRSSWSDPLTYIRLFGHIFGHSGWEHFFNNALYLLIVGPAVEERYGSMNLMGAMAVTAVVSGLAHMFLSPHSALLGASGIVFMLIFLASLSGMRRGSLPLTLILVAVIYLGQEIHAALFLHDGVSHLTHIIGGVCGTLLGFRMRRNHKR